MENPFPVYLEAIAFNNVAPIRSDRDGVHEIHHCYDIIGYAWALASQNLVPQAIAPNFPNVSYVLSVPHDNFSWSIVFYTERFGAVQLHLTHDLTANEELVRNAGRAYLRLGHVERPLILELLGSYPRPTLEHW